MQSRLVTIIAVTSALMLGCELSDDESSDSNSSNYSDATLTHSGFDFSAGIESAEVDYDGETISWQPGGADNPAYPRDTHLWWRPSGNRQTKDLGTVDMDTVTSAPGTWDVSPNIPPLLVGHVVVTECSDGYAKFEVLSVDTNAAGWPVKVRYYYSATTTFDK